MADDTGKEHLDNSLDTQPENTSDEVISSTNTATIPENQETETMEVHHHAHHGGKKNWKSYIWEFLMLFLAVFCGFLAEYQLEHLVEHNKEKQYIKGLVNELKSDIKVVENGVKYNIKVAKGKDSLVQLINRGITTGKQIDTFYALHKAYVGINRQYLFAKATITQLLSAGNLRLIRNKNVADSISLYSSRIDYFEKQLMPQFIYYVQKTLDASEGLIDTKYFVASVENGNYDYLPTANAAFVNNNDNLLKAFSFRLEIDKEGNLITITNLQSLGRGAERLLLLIKKVYDLE